ncbi:hypothetical protein K438DRAFT_635512 [Mycena galopus ATCC 62051]|nr:hypothetical protein K438DRAFT_635512 [Mycena galopus ATCC 62051]
MSLREFPPELLTRLFLHLSYKSLLRVQAVCVQWNAIVAKDPQLSVQMFKKLSTVYVEPGCSKPSFQHESGPGTYAPNSEPVRLHPALNEASYYMGNDLKSVTFYTGSNRDYPQLFNLAIANDFISIPVVTMVKVAVPRRGLNTVGGFKFKIKNPKGIKLTDVFAAMHKNSNIRDVLTSEGIMARAEALGNHRYYEGFQTVARTGLGISAELWMGS